jgi:hypothetical protein
MYTKIPLSLFKIKKEVKISEEVVVYDIHCFDLLAYKSNAINNINKQNSKFLRF